MLRQNGYAQYQNSKIMTASPAELTLMLYEGAIKFGNIAILAMENKDPAKAHENVVKVEKIIQNFRETLDKRYPIWEDFEKVEQLNSMSQLYKQAGNSIVVDVLEKILKNLYKMHFIIIK